MMYSPIRDALLSWHGSFVGKKWQKAWKTIRNGWKDLKVGMHFKVGFGNRVKFWKDRWCGDVPLRDTFPDLFSIASSKDARVADAWDGGSWNPRFIRQLNDWELEEVDIFFERLYDHAIFMDTEDSVEWVDTKSSIFSVRSFYFSLASRGVDPFPHSI